MSDRRRFRTEDAEVLGDERVFDGYFQVHRRTIRHRAFAGGWCEPVTREVFERGNAVGVLPYEPVDDSIILIEQFRAGSLRDESSPWMMELVAGIVEPGEGPEEVARREAMEEAGCELSELEPIARYYPSAGACSEHVVLYMGRALSDGAGKVLGLDTEGEDILVHRLPRAEVMAMLARGEINNGHTLVALQWLALHGDDLRARWLAAG
ncbi:MAG: NUDIX domain-containing protein [Pseudomonadota bacterium]